MSNASIDDLIDDLAGDLEPVRPRRVAHGSRTEEARAID